MNAEQQVAELEVALGAKDARNIELEAQVATLMAQVAALTKQVADLTERLGQNSRNSHLPPSSDPPGSAGKAGSGTQPKSARKRGGQRGHARARVQFVHADLAAYEPTGRYDLVVTHFVLDCFDETGVATLAARLTATLAPGGRWLLANVRVPTGALRALRARFWLAVMYGFFRIATKLRVKRLVDPTPILERNGLVRARWTELGAGFVGSAMWASPATASPRPRAAAILERSDSEMLRPIHRPWRHRPLPPGLETEVADGRFALALRRRCGRFGAAIAWNPSSP